MDMFDPIIFALATAAAGFLTEGLKRSALLPDRFAFIAALVFGVAVAVAVRAAGYGAGTLAAAAVAGLFAGAAAAGVYSGTKAMRES